MLRAWLANPLMWFVVINLLMVCGLKVRADIWAMRHPRSKLLQKPRNPRQNNLRGAIWASIVAFETYTRLRPAPRTQRRKANVTSIIIRCVILLDIALAIRNLDLAQLLVFAEAAYASFMLLAFLIQAEWTAATITKRLEFITLAPYSGIVWFAAGR